MDPNPLLTKAQAVFRRRKEKLVAAGGVGADMDACLVIVQGGRAIAGYQFPDEPAEIQALVITAIGLSDADAVVVASDAYVDIGTGMNNVADLRQRFANGDLSVSEAIGILVVDRNRRHASCWDTYRFTGTKVCWTQQMPNVHVIEHAQLIRDIHDGFTMQAQRPEPALLTDGSTLSVVGHHHLDQGILVEFAIHAGCLCGSGRPADYCCQIRN